MFGNSYRDNSMKKYEIGHSQLELFEDLNNQLQ